MASLGFMGLSDDIIIAIATQLKRESKNNADLLSFTLASKQCYHLGLPIFYGNIALGDKTLERFTNSFNATDHGEHVRSLTVRIEAVSSIHPKALALFPGLATAPPMRGSGFGSSHASTGASSSIAPSKKPSGFASSPAGNATASQIPLEDRISRLVPPLPSFTKLTSFSLRVEESPWRSIPRKVIVTLLEALPESCTNLELDTHGQDHRQEEEQVHVCDTIRRLLPRMHNVRIRVGAMCSAMFGTHTSQEKDVTGEYVPIALPKIKSLVVNCGLPFGMQMQRCGKKDYTTSAKHHEWPEGLSWAPITAGLIKLAEKFSENLQNALIYAIIGTGSDINNQICQTEIRVDMVGREGWAFPSLPLGGPFGKPRAYLVRLHDDSEVVTIRVEDIEAIAEGQLWKDVIGGARLPAEVLDAESKGLPSFARGCVELPLATKTFDESTNENPSTREPSWTILNEQKVGMKLVLAEKRIGEDYLSIRPVKELTPEGWVRTSDHLGIERM